MRELIGCTIVGVLAAGAVVYTFDHDATIAPVTAPLMVAPLTTGPPIPNGWEAVTQELGDTLAEGDDEPPANAGSRDWESCLVRWDSTTGDAAYTVVCPDGYKTTS